jgi:hypothetical protein
MSKWHLLLAVGVWRISLPLSVLHAAEPDSQMVEFFEKEVRPVLVSRTTV